MRFALFLVLLVQVLGSSTGAAEVVSSATDFSLLLVVCMGILLGLWVFGIVAVVFCTRSSRSDFVKV